MHGQVAQVTLSHPGKFNAMSRAMWRELKAVFEDLQGRADIRCVIVAGESGHFCAGGDIAEYPDFRFDEVALRAFHEDEVWGGLGAMLACDLPLLAQIEGNCMGAGVEMASCCDIRVASAGARFGAPIAKLGFPMAPREAALVAREAGAATAREMLLEAAVFDATEMKARGFLNTVLPDGTLTSAVLARAQRIVALRCRRRPRGSTNRPCGPRRALRIQRETVPSATPTAPNTARASRLFWPNGLQSSDFFVTPHC